MRLAARGAAPVTPGGASSTADRLGRTLGDLRISVTDRCNFRCRYCMPREVFGPKHDFLPNGEILNFEEITRLARAAANLGVRKIRLTGGEPLLRRELEILVESLRGIDGIEITLTTNGALLARKAEALRTAGLDRVTVSLDALDDATFWRMTDSRFRVSRVLEGIGAAIDVGLTPVKVNMVVRRGVNEQAVLPMARYFKERGQILRFIEFMDVGETNRWRRDEVMAAEEIAELIDAEMPLTPAPPTYPGEVANRFRYSDGLGEIGVIASVTQPFCGSCTRARISADGRLYTCLFASRGHDVKALLREGADDDELGAFLAGVWGRRSDRYSEVRAAEVVAPKAEMSYLGG